MRILQDPAIDTAAGSYPIAPVPRNFPASKTDLLDTCSGLARIGVWLDHPPDLVSKNGATPLIIHLSSTYHPSLQDFSSNHPAIGLWNPSAWLNLLRWPALKLMVIRCRGAELGGTWHYQRSLGKHNKDPGGFMMFQTHFPHVENFHGLGF